MLVLIKISSLINVGNVVKIDWPGLDKGANGRVSHCCLEMTHGLVTSDHWGIMSPNTGGIQGIIH